MRLPLQEKRLSVLLKHRSFLVVTNLLCLLIIFILSIAVLFKRERVIMTPPEMNQAFWVEEKAVSATYLEEMSFYFAKLLLDATPSNIAYQHSIILRYVMPESYGALRAKLFEDAELLTKQNLSTSFIPTVIQVNQKLAIAEITGTLVRYMGKNMISQTKDTYILTYQHSAGRLWIQSFALKESQ